MKVEEYDTSCPPIKSTKVKRYLHRGGRQLGYSSTVADDEISLLSLKTTVTKKKERQRKMAKAFKQGPATISLKGHKEEKRGFKQSVKSTAEDPKEEAPIAMAKETFPNVKVKEDDASCPAVKSTKIGRYLHQGGRGARSSTNVVDDDLLTTTSLVSLKSTASLASNYFSAIMSLTKKKGMQKETKGGMQKETKGKRGKAVMQGPATISRENHKTEKQFFKLGVKSKHRLSEEIKSLKVMMYQLQSKIDETNVRENTASGLCNGCHAIECLEYFFVGDDETVSTEVSSQGLFAC